MGLKEAAEVYRDACAEYDRITEELRQICREGREAGIPVAEIAEAASVSRQTIYDWTRSCA